MIVAVTGAGGFIGGRLCAVLADRGHEVRRLSRRGEDHAAGPHTTRRDGDTAHWPSLLGGVEVVLHLAGRAHVLRREQDPEAEFMHVNVELSRKLAEDAAAACVRRLVFVSSIGVNGSKTNGQPFTERDPPRPVDPYSRSKLHAEHVLRELTASKGIELVVVRPPMVYGCNPKGNLLRLIQLLSTGFPLPLASVRNQRNVVSLENLCSALALCVESSAAAGETFLVAEPQARSTADIMRALYRGMGRSSRLVPCPEWLLGMAARMVGRSTEFEKMCSSLEVDASKIHHVLGWSPTQSFEDGMSEAAACFQRNSRATRRSTAIS